MYSSDIFYTQFAQSYDDYVSTKIMYLSAVNNFIKNETGKVKTMVDVGAGNGRRSKLIAELLRINFFTLIDNSDGMITLSRSISGAEIIKSDISNVEFIPKEEYDVVLCLWNVLGHIPFDNRLIAFKNLASLVNQTGVIFLDVNNRYNISQYGIRAVIVNICKDVFYPKKSNGDFILNVNTEKGAISTNVHIFNSSEIERLIKSAGLTILKRQIINYKTGETKGSIFGGQLVYKLCKIL